MDKWVIRKNRNKCKGSWVALPPWESCVGGSVKAQEFGTLLRLVTSLVDREKAGEDKRSLREELQVHRIREEYLAA